MFIFWIPSSCGSAADLEEAAADRGAASASGGGRNKLKLKI